MENQKMPVSAWGRNTSNVMASSPPSHFRHEPCSLLIAVMTAPAEHFPICRCTRSSGASSACRASSYRSGEGPTASSQRLLCAVRPESLQTPPSPSLSAARELTTVAAQRSRRPALPLRARLRLRRQTRRQNAVTGVTDRWLAPQSPDNRQGPVADHQHSTIWRPTAWPDLPSTAHPTMSPVSMSHRPSWGGKRYALCIGSSRLASFAAFHRSSTRLF